MGRAESRQEKAEVPGVVQVEDAWAPGASCLHPGPDVAQQRCFPGRRRQRSGVGEAAPQSSLLGAAEPGQGLGSPGLVGLALFQRMKLTGPSGWRRRSFRAAWAGGGGAR